MLSGVYKNISNFFNNLFLVIKYLFFLLIALLIVLFLIFLPSYKELSLVTKKSLEAKDNLEQAVYSIKDFDFSKAQEKSSLAKDDFSLALSKLEEVSQRRTIRRIGFLTSQLNDFKYLIRTGEISSRALSNSSFLLDGFYKEFISSNILTTLDGNVYDSKRSLIELAYQSSPELIGLKANLELALMDLNRINKFGLMYPFYSKISFAKEELQLLINNLEKSIYLSRVIPYLAGYPEPGNFLLIMQNNDELRPSGGFIGVFGLMKTENATIKSLATYDSYHLDMPAVVSGKWSLQPPEPLAKYLKVKNWYLRDANWSPDWPTSAKNIQKIYHGEKAAISEESEDFNAVISFNPDFVAELFDITGPIMARGELYEKENFQELLQYSVEVSYLEEDISSWDRKDVINEILYELKERLLNLSLSDFYLLVNIVSNNVANKNIQVYFNNDELQLLARKLNAAGDVKNSLGDYLLVVDANLAAFKSDAVVRKSIDYDLNLKKDGSLSKLRLSYKHEGSFDWRTTRYRSYTRVYTPLGSKLESLNSFGFSKIDKESIISYDDKDLNKTVFAFFFSLEPGTAGGIDLEYRLSEDLNSYLISNPYTLLVQKQSGRRTNSFNFNLKKENTLKFSQSYPLEKDFLIVFD